MNPYRYIKIAQMPLRHQVTKVHKVLYAFNIYFVKPLCFRAFVAKDTLCYAFNNFKYSY